MNIHAPGFMFDLRQNGSIKPPVGSEKYNGYEIGAKHKQHKVIRVTQRDIDFSVQLLCLPWGAAQAKQIEKLAKKFYRGSK